MPDSAGDRRLAALLREAATTLAVAPRIPIAATISGRVGAQPAAYMPFIEELREIAGDLEGWRDPPRAAVLRLLGSMASMSPSVPALAPLAKEAVALLRPASPSS